MQRSLSVYAEVPFAVAGSDLNPLNRRRIPMSMSKSLVTILAAVALCALSGCDSLRTSDVRDPVRRVAFNGDNFDGWRQPTGAWEVVGAVALDPGDPKTFHLEPGYGVMVNGRKGPTVDLVSSFEHGDVEAHVEFCVPKGSNSGVYFQGRYEVQILDSWGVAKPTFTDCGGIYERWQDGKGFEGHAPRVNASRPPGEWQSFDVVFRAPRFDEFGNKTENARFSSVMLNGVLVQVNVEVSGPTRAALDEKTEAAFGPLMLQGDHGPVAYRNIVLRHVTVK
jgi:hypothetical protein